MQSGAHNSTGVVPKAAFALAKFQYYLFIRVFTYVIYKTCDSLLTYTLLRDEIVYILFICLCNAKRNFKSVTFNSYAINICRVRSLSC